jgi:GNAT superfamily N-acetyltransferase
MANPLPAFSVREAAAADASTIADLAVELGYHVDAEDVHHRLAALPAAHVVLVATTPERVVGWLHAFHSQSVLHGDRVEIAGLAVAADHQGQGVGTVLIAHLERWTRHLGIQAIRVLSGSERIAAHRFYGSRGYRQLKTEQVFTKSLQLG